MQNNEQCGRTSWPAGESVRSAFRRWRWILCITVLGAAAGALVTAWMPVRYQAEARVRLLRDLPGSTLSPELRSIPDDLLGARDQIQVMHSSRILNLVVDRLDLRQRWADSSGPISTAAAVKRLGDSFSPARNFDGRLVRVIVSDQDPALAAQIANTIVQVYAVEAARPRGEQWWPVVKQLQAEADAQGRRLVEAQLRTQQLRQSGAPLVVAPSDNPLLRQLQQSLGQAKATLADLKVRSSLMDSAARAGGLWVQLALAASDLGAQATMQKLGEASQRLARLELAYGRQHPSVQAAQVDCEQLQAAARERLAFVREGLDMQLLVAQQRSEQIEQELASQQRGQPDGGATATLRAAMRQEELEQNLYRLLNDKMQRMWVELQTTSPAAELIDAAVPPLQPAGATSAQAILLGALAGLLGGILLARWIDRLDTSIRTVDEVSALLGLPLLGTIARPGKMSATARRGRDLEAYRMVRNVVDSTEGNIQSLCVLGAARREGASLSTANLALAWAEQGARVLVIDTAVRRASMHELFNTAADAGLSDYLRGTRTLEEVVRTTGQPNVGVIGAGSAPVQRGPLNSQQVREILDWARSRADMVLFDAGPVLDSSEAALVARQADAAIFVVRQSHLPLRSLRRAAHLIAASGINLLGVVLTGASEMAWEAASLDGLDFTDYREARTRTTQTRIRQNEKRAA